MTRDAIPPDNFMEWYEVDYDVLDCHPDRVESKTFENKSNA